VDDKFRKYLIWSIAIFAISALVSIFVVIYAPDLFPYEIITTQAQLQQRATEDMNMIFLMVLSNNALILFFIMSSAIAKTKLIPGAIEAINGFAVGGVITKTTIVYGTMFTQVFIPHAFIEFAAIILAVTYSFVAIDIITEASPHASLKEYMTAKLKIRREIINKYILRPYFTRVLPIVIVAALIEAYISFRLFTMVVGS
jgi:uncharacterized membrane protein SpoIIM required for sporulation